MKTEHCILIPTINRKDLLAEALDWYLKNLETSIIVLDNGKQGPWPTEPQLAVFESEKNKGVAGSWNWLIRKAIETGFESFLVLNDDIVLQRGDSEISEIIETWGENSFHRPRPFYNWSAFLINKTIFERVGQFDEAFVKCFFEDNDYEHRMRVAGVNVRYEDALNADVYRNSQTILKDPLLGDYVANREYYLRKWGGPPGEEQYKTPFNQ